MENAILTKEKIFNDDLMDSLDYEALDEKMQNQLDKELANMQFLVEDQARINNPNDLGNAIMDVVWDQFLNQIAVVAGEDFIKENRGLTLDLRDEAHIQTTDNFAKGKIATHNTEINYQERYDDWQSNFARDENGNIRTYTNRAGRKDAILVKGARKPFDKGRPKGSAQKQTDMDHTIAAGEMIRDPALNAHVPKEKQIEFANSPANLNEIPASVNRSKKDLPMREYLDHPNAKGQKASEVHNISPEQEADLRQQDDTARVEMDKLKKEGEEISIAAGKKTQREEAFRIGGKALRSAVMTLVAQLLKEIISKLVKWFKTAERTLSTLLDSIGEAIHGFVTKLKDHLLTAGTTVLHTVVAAIMGPIFGVLQKAWMVVQQGWKSLKDAINYFRDPANQDKPFAIRLMEVGKLIIAGLTGAGAILLGEGIEKVLMAIPVFAVPIPLLGSLANLLGIFFGAVVAGILGAIAINRVEKMIENRLKRENVNAQIKKGNEVLVLQHQVRGISEDKLEKTKEKTMKASYGRHTAAAEVTQTSIENIRGNCQMGKRTQVNLEETRKGLDELEAW